MTLPIYISNQLHKLGRYCQVTYVRFQIINTDFLCLAELLKQTIFTSNMNTEDGDSVQKKYYLVSWNTVCKSKSQEVLGVLDLDKMNKALLGKWWVRF